MRLLDQAQRRIYRNELSGYLEDRQRAEKEEEFNRAHAEIDSQLAAGTITQLRYDEVKNELGRMHQETFGVPETETGGPGSIIFNEGG